MVQRFLTLHFSKSDKTYDRQKRISSHAGPFFMQSYRSPFLETYPRIYEVLSQRTRELWKASCKHRSALARGGVLRDLAEGPMRIFPSFSWQGKCDSRERSESEHQRCVARVPRLQPDRNSPLYTALKKRTAFADRFLRKTATLASLAPTPSASLSLLVR